MVGWGRGRCGRQLGELLYSSNWVFLLFTSGELLYGGLAYNSFRLGTWWGWGRGEFGRQEGQVFHSSSSIFLFLTSGELLYGGLAYSSFHPQDKEHSSEAKQVLMSPTIKYAGSDLFCEKHKYVLLILGQSFCLSQTSSTILNQEKNTSKIHMQAQTCN